MKKTQLTIVKRFHQSYLSLVFINLGSTYLAYVYLVNQSKLGLCCLFTLCFCLLNIGFIALICNTKYAGQVFGRPLENPWSVFCRDLVACWVNTKPILVYATFLGLFLVGYPLFGILILGGVVVFLSIFYNPVGVFFLYFVFVTFLFCLVNLCAEFYYRFVSPRIKKEIFSLNHRQQRLVYFFKKYNKALQDPFVVFLGLLSFLRESSLFYVLIFLFFFRFDGGLSFCLLATFYIFVSYLTFLPMTREILFKKYDVHCLKDLSYNMEIVKGVIAKGPRVAAACVALGLGHELLVSGRRYIEQIGINSLHAAQTDAANAAADATGRPRSEPTPVPQAPRRSLLTGKPIK